MTVLHSKSLKSLSVIYKLILTIVFKISQQKEYKTKYSRSKHFTLVSYYITLDSSQNSRFDTIHRLFDYVDFYFNTKKAEILTH